MSDTPAKPPARQAGARTAAFERSRLEARKDEQAAEARADNMVQVTIGSLTGQLKEARTTIVSGSQNHALAIAAQADAHRKTVRYYQVFSAVLVGALLALAGVSWNATAPDGSTIGVVAQPPAADQ